MPALKKYQLLDEKDNVAVEDGLAVNLLGMTSFCDEEEKKKVEVSLYGVSIRCNVY